jgi:hypothetical protein
MRHRFITDRQLLPIFKTSIYRRRLVIGCRQQLADFSYVVFSYVVFSYVVFSHIASSFKTTRLRH